MNAGRLDTLEQRLRSLVAEESLEAVPAALQEYVAEVARQARQLPADAPGTGELRERAQSLLSWTRTMVEMGRAHDAATLQRLPRPGAFACPPPQNHRTDLSA